ncbi:MAG TPA: mechanosensitive ion channel family protein [Polyangiaceae bacterium]
MRPTARASLLVLVAAGFAAAIPDARAAEADAGAPAPVPAPAGSVAPAPVPKARPPASAPKLGPTPGGSATTAPSSSAAAADAGLPDAAAPDAAALEVFDAAIADPAPSASIDDAALLAVPPTPSAMPVVVPPAPVPAPESKEKMVAPGVSVRFADQSVFAIRVARGGRTLEERAAAVTKMLVRAAAGAKGSDVKVQRKGDVAIVLVGSTPIVQLIPEDAMAAGDVSLDVHAASVAAAVRDAIDSERRRAAIAQSVVSISLLVFLGLVAFYLLQKVSEFARRARAWVDEHGETALAVRVRRIEVVSPGTVKSTAIVGLGVGKWIAQVAVVYLWIVYALSQFEATRGYTQRLTGLVLTPLSDLLARIAIGLPVLVVLVIAGFAVFVLVRFVGLFFSSVGRRENVVPWIPQDLVPPVSSLVRFGIIVGALLFIAPLITGSSEGVLARAGWVVVLSLGLAATPVLSNGLVGSVVLFGRRLRAGQYVEIGDHRGRITTIGLLELSLEDDDGVETLVPHLYTLLRPTRIVHAKSAPRMSRPP